MLIMQTGVVMTVRQLRYKQLLKGCVTLSAFSEASPYRVDPTFWPENYFEGPITFTTTRKNHGDKTTSKESKAALR